MISEKNASRLLGAAFLIVIVTSLASGMLLKTAVGSGSISDMLVNISNHLTLMQISSVVDLLTSLGIIAMASLLYVVLRKQNRVIALISLGWWLAEAITLAMSKMGSLALIPLSLDFVQAGSPAHSFYQTLGEYLYYGVYRQEYTLHMWFYCAGGLLWYSLFYQSRAIPRAISLFGLIAVSVSMVAMVLTLFGYQAPIVLSMPVGLFELAIGFWLMLKGTRDGSAAAVNLASAQSTH